MKNFLLNWNFKKHLAIEIMSYSCFAIIGNSWLAKKAPEQEKTLNPVTIIEQMPKRQKCFNAVLLSCFLTDLTASFCFLRYLRNKIK